MSANGEPQSTVVLPDSFLTLHYRLYDDFGTVYLSTFGLSPATLPLGCGQLAEALEHCLVGLRRGERRCFEFGPGDAFGHYNPQLVEPISRNALPAEIELQGNSLVEFSGPGDNAKVAGLLRELTKTTATIDFNHPLAGKAVRFEVEIIGIL